MDLNQPKLMSDIIDIGVANGDISYVLNVGFKMIVVAMLGILGGMLCGLFSTLASMNMGKNMRQGLFDKIQSLSFSEIERFKTSSLITRLTNDFTQVQFFTKMQKKIDNVNLVMRENLLGVRVIKAFEFITSSNEYTIEKLDKEVKIYKEDKSKEFLLS